MKPLISREEVETPEEAEIVERVVGLAYQLFQGEIGLADVRGGSTGYERNVAIRKTPPESKDFPILMTMFDALVAAQTTFNSTAHGQFTLEEIIEAKGRVCADGHVGFPIRQPWRVKPDKETGDPGVRGNPVYKTDWYQKEDK